MLVVSCAEASRDKNVTIPGDFIIGAMFPLTTAENCGQDIVDQNGIQNLEALIFSLKKVNKEILHDISKYSFRYVSD